MKRVAVLVAAAVAGGCVISESSGDANVYWTFQHYDTSTATYQALTCLQARVDTVVLDFSDGTTTTVPCSQGGVDGVSVLDFVPGAYWVNVTGYRNGVTPALYASSSVSFAVYSGAATDVSVDVPGRWDDLELLPVLNRWNGAAYVPYASPACTNAGIDAISYLVKDGAGFTLAMGSEACSTDPASVVFSGSNGIDLDTLSIRMQGWAGTALVMDSGATTFPHFGNDTGPYGDVVDLY